MTINSAPKVNKDNTRPPYLIILVGLLAVACFAAFLGYVTFRSQDGVYSQFRAIERMWDDRAANSSLPNQEQTLSNTIEDKQALKTLESKYNGLFKLIASAIGAVVGVVLLGFLAFHTLLVGPLRRMEESVRKILDNGLQGHIWGLDRDDHYGALARRIDEVRNNIVKLSDMVVENADGKSYVQFGGRGAATFNTLVADIQDALSALNAKGERLEAITREKEASVKQLDETVEKTTQSLEAAVDASRLQLAGLQDEWIQRFTTLSSQHGHIQEQAGRLVEQFSRDMGTLRQVSVATGQRVTQMLQNLGSTDMDYKRAAKLSLEASQNFSKQAQELSEKLNAATTILRASGKVMQETTESTRARLMEAIASVTKHDDALKIFLDETADKTGRVTSLFDDMTASAGRVAQVVVSFDERMKQFEEKSDAAFTRIETGSTAIEGAASDLKQAQEVVAGSMHAMQSHTEMLASILATIRDEYTSFMTDWRGSLSEAIPAVNLLREISQKLHTQLSDEWVLYAQQSRQLLAALEHDVRTMNARTAQVAEDADKLISGLSSQTQRIGDSANAIDLQIANLSQRVEDAAGNVLRSNEHIVNLTSSQVREVHTAVTDMVQRLGILTQLTGTLGSVAGQLGQIVPALSDMRQMERAGIPVLSASSSAMDADMLSRFEKIAGEFGGTVTFLKDEFNGVRGQISKWVDLLTHGYQHLAGEIGSIDSLLTQHLGALKDDLAAAASANTGGDILPVLKLMHQSLEANAHNESALAGDIQTLQNHMQAMGEHVQKTVGILQGMGTVMSEGFTRLDQQFQEQPRVMVDGSVALPVPDTSRIEQASKALEGVLASMQSQSSTLVEKLGEVTMAINFTSSQLQNQIADATARVEKATQDTQAGKSPSRSELQAQIQAVTSLLGQCAQESELLGSDNPELVAEKSHIIAEAIKNAVARLKDIVGADETPPPAPEDAQKAG